MRDGWQVAPLGKFISQSKKKVKVQDGFEYPAVGVMMEGRGFVTRPPFVGGVTTYKQLTPIEPNQLVLRSITAWEAPIQVTTQAQSGFHVSGVFPVFDIDASSLNPKFLSLLCRYEPFWASMRERTVGSVLRRKTLSATALMEIPIQLPPLPEQKRIVDLISSVDSYIEALQQQLETTKKSKNAVLHELLTVSGDEFEYKALSDICEVRDGTHDSPKPSHEGFALVTSKNIKDGKLDLESAYLISPQDYVEVNKRSKVERFNLLISMIGTIGEVIVVEEEPNFAIKNVGLLKSSNPILSRYLCHYLGSQFGKSAVSLSVSGSTQKFISLGKLRELRVLYPSEERQKAIVELMTLFDHQISKNLELVVRTRKLRSALLSQLLSGEHEIPTNYDIIIGAAQ